jgi:hypothetical protein
MKAIFGFIVMSMLLAVKLSAQTIDVIDFENGDFSEWAIETSGSNEHGISDLACGGEFSGYWVSDGYRTESASKRYPILGQDIWYGWAVFVPETFCVDCSATVSQIHGFHPSCVKKHRVIVHLRIRDGHWGLAHRKLKGSPVGGDVYNLRPVHLGAWTYILVNAKLTASNDGFIKVWINNELVSERRGYTWYADCNNGPYFKAGLYAGAPKGETIVVDEFRIGFRRSDVDPQLFCKSVFP